MDRVEWRSLSHERVIDADILLKGGRWSAAYHLLGYAVECGLKACVLAFIENGNAGILFEQRRYSEQCWTHNLEDLVNLAGLRAELEAASKANLPLDASWERVILWT